MVIQPITQSSSSGLSQQLHQVANMTNDEIIQHSCESGNNVAQNNLSGKLLKALPALAVIGVAAVSGMLTKGKLSSKVKNTLGTVGTFALVSAIFDGVQAGSKKIEEKSNTVKETNKKYPLVGALANLGASLGASALALKGVKKGAKKFVEKFPNLAARYKEMSKSVANVIDSSRLSTLTDSVMNVLKKGAKKCPKLASFVKRNSFPLMIVGYIGLSTLLVAKNERDKQKAAYSKAEELNAQRQQAQDTLNRANQLQTTSV